MKTRNLLAELRAGSPLLPTVVCLPYAGGGSHVYMPLCERLPAGFPVVSVDPPGRRTRIGVSPYQCIEAYADSLLGEIERSVSSPWILFGHSLGALVGYRLLLRILQRGSRAPLRFIASGCRAPHLSYRYAGAHALKDRDFRRFLAELGGTPVELLEDDCAYMLFDASLRADFRLADAVCALPSETISGVPATVLYAVDDAVVTVEDAARTFLERRVPRVRWRALLHQRGICNGSCRCGCFAVLGCD